MSSDPWLCVPASRLVCLYRRGFQDNLVFDLDDKARLMPQKMAAKSTNRRNLVATFGETLSFTARGSSSSIKLIVSFGQVCLSSWQNFLFCVTDDFFVIAPKTNNSQK